MEYLKLIFKAIFIAVFAVIILAWPVQLLWNAFLVTAIDGIHPISFGQALGIMLLASILFKNNSVSKND
jgi:hypothetical protein